jgi:hypothetical protein
MTLRCMPARSPKLRQISILMPRPCLVTQGTRSEAGNRWCERIWTAIATCGQQGRSVFAYLQSAVEAWFAGTGAPSLLPAG